MNNDIKIEIESRFGFQEGQIPTEIQHLQMVSFRNGAEWMRERLIDKAWEFMCTHYVVGMEYDDFVKAMEE